MKEPGSEREQPARPSGRAGAAAAAVPEGGGPRWAPRCEGPPRAAGREPPGLWGTSGPALWAPEGGEPAASDCQWHPQHLCSRGAERPLEDTAMPLLCLFPPGKRWKVDAFLSQRHDCGLKRCHSNWLVLHL